MLFFALLTHPAAAVYSPKGAFDTLSTQCGKAFRGQVTRFNEGDDRWRQAVILIHVRDCSDRELKIPLHVDDDRSRVWIIRRTDRGMQLKHDHRHADGHPDTVTMYGGHTALGADIEARKLSFPVDQESINLFNANNLTASTVNVWHLSVEEGIFRYGLTRPNRDFEVTFDLSKPVALPPAAWDKVKH